MNILREQQKREGLSGFIQSFFKPQPPKNHRTQRRRIYNTIKSYSLNNMRTLNQVKNFFREPIMKDSKGTKIISNATNENIKEVLNIIARRKVLETRQQNKLRKFVLPKTYYIGNVNNNSKEIYSKYLNNLEKIKSNYIKRSSNESQEINKLVEEYKGKINDLKTINITRIENSIIKRSQELNKLVEEYLATTKYPKLIDIHRIRNPKLLLENYNKSKYKNIWRPQYN